MHRVTEFKTANYVSHNDRMKIQTHQKITAKKGRRTEVRKRRNLALLLYAMFWRRRCFMFFGPINESIHHARMKVLFKSHGSWEPLVLMCMIRTIRYLGTYLPTYLPYLLYLLYLYQLLIVCVSLERTDAS